MSRVCVRVRGCLGGSLVESLASNPRVAGLNPTRAGGKKKKKRSVVPSNTSSPPAHQSVKRVPGLVLEKQSVSLTTAGVGGMFGAHTCYRADIAGPPASFLPSSRSCIAITHCTCL